MEILKMDMMTFAKLLKTTALVFLSMAVVACSQPEAEKALTPPDFMESYSRDPFGSEQFHAFKRASDPLWACGFQYPYLLI
jgi:hypothetical protein